MPTGTAPPPDTATQTTVEFPDNRLLIDLCGPFDRNLTAIEGALEMRPLKSMGVDTREVRITLGTERHGKIRSALRADGTFTVPDAPPGPHVLDVHATGLT